MRNPTTSSILGANTPAEKCLHQTLLEGLGGVNLAGNYQSALVDRRPNDTQRLSPFATIDFGVRYTAHLLGDAAFLAQAESRV